MHLNFNQIILVVSTLLVLVMLSFSAQGIRGTDQFQYVADTDMIRAGTTQETNLFFPAKILREKESVSPNHFNHNGPLLHMAAKLESFSSYHAWILLNLICHFIVAICIWITASKYSTVLLASCATALYIISPIAVWQSANPLQETFFAAITALMLSSWLSKENFFFRLTLLCTVVVGVLAHPFFLALALFFAGFLALNALRNKSVSDGIMGLAILLCVVLTKLLLSDYFPSQFQPSLKAIITSSQPGVSKMLWHYSLTQPELSLSLLMSKIGAAVKMHLFSPINSPFYLFTNLAILSILSWPFLKRRPSIEVALVLMFCISLYLAIIVLQQNDARYQQIVAPATFVILAITFNNMRSKYIQTLTVVLLLGSVVVDSMLVKRLADDGKDQTAAIHSLSESFSDIDPSKRIVAIDVGPHGPLAYALRPHKVLSVRTQFMSDTEIAEVLSSFNADYLISMSGANEQQPLLSNKSVLSNHDNLLFGEITIFALTEPAN